MRRLNFSFPTLIGAAAILVLFIHMSAIFWPYLSGTMSISNDYLFIPGETHLNGRYVQNSSYVKSIIPYKDLFKSGEAAGGTGNRAGTEGLIDVTSQSLEFQAFMDRNWMEIHFQAQCGWIMHHHNSMLAPVNEYLLGKPVTEINHQYGWLNTLLLGHLIKWTGGVTFQNYFRVFYSFYSIYYLLFLGAAFLLTGGLRYVLLTALISFSFLHLLTYVDILLAPGFNPLRQIFYLPVTLFLFFHLKKGGLRYLLLASLFALVSILSNKEFGLFVAAALVVCLVLRRVHERGRKQWGEAGIIAATAIFAAGLVLYAKIGKNPIGQYYFLGISGPPMEKPVLVAALLILSAAYAFFLKILQFRDDLKYVAIFLFFYSQGVFLYYVWNSAPNHFFSVASPILLGAVLFLKLSLEATSPNRYAKPILRILLLGAFLGLYLPSIWAYYAGKEKYERIFENRRVFEWNLPTAKFRTTMDPAYVLEAVRLIQRYSPQKRAIYIISKYDNLLPFLAARYSAMPFSEVATSLLTPQENTLCMTTILELKPEFIFVDTDLIENPSGPGIDLTHPMYLLASQYFDLKPKLEMLQELTRVYLGVRHRYEVAEKGPLLSVCRKKERWAER